LHVCFFFILDFATIQGQWKAGRAKNK
jgi:hypothetical protein